MLHTLDRNYHAWFREAGASLIIPRIYRAQLTLSRALPLLLWLFTSAIVQVLAWYFLIEISASDAGVFRPDYIDISSDFFLGMSLIITLCLPLLLFILIWWAVNRWTQKTPLWVSSILAIGLIPLTGLALSPATSYAVGFQEPLLYESGWSIALVLGGTLLASYLGVDTLLHWVFKQIIREFNSLTIMVVKVLPVLMIAVLFFFVNGDIWRVVDHLSFGRVFQVVSILATLGLLVSISTVYDRGKKILGAREGDSIETFSPQEYATAAQAAGPHWEESYRKLNPSTLENSPAVGRGEWYNLSLLPLLTQSIQALLFSLLVFGFFLWFGEIAIPDATITSWLTHEAPKLTLAGLTLPYSAVLVKVSMVLGAFAGLNFMAQTATDPSYSKEFLEPSLHHVRQVLIIRNIYLASYRELVAEHNLVGQEEHEQGDSGI